MTTTTDELKLILTPILDFGLWSWLATNDDDVDE